MKSKLFVLGFVEDSSDSSKLSIEINGYKIRIDLNEDDFSKSTIDYGSKILIHHQGICTFQKPEYLVQLECVIRLLSKGYKPENIELEKTYKLGHKDKGRLDVYIKKAKNAWALIECKTFGSEYENERNNVLKDGGQIFSYFTQDRSAEVICIYASEIQNNVVNYISEQILTENLDKGSDNKAIFESWNKEFINNGFFDSLSGLYETKRINLRKKDLIDLTKDNGKTLYNEFAEILRKYVISDKSNAFNVIFNLFVCKIFDEDIKSSVEELDFQIKTGDDDITLMTRLSSLYKESVEKYLSLKMDEKYFSTEKKIALKEFQFIDVFNDETFKLNSKILAEVVILLQKYRIKYSTRHQFLGDFFENLLNSGVKQEAGQFFTPIPLVRFILKSLPIETIIKNKIALKEPYILPHIIDYACGAGHFLTESIEEINSHFDIIDESTLSGQQLRFFTGTKNNYLWAKDYIYGIEKDHRLAKTTKIAMFLNGDGDAAILSGDGLDDFYYSSKYSGLLKSDVPCQTLGQFDILVSNPPFSVEGFYNNVKNPKSNFCASNYITTKSQEIECFFIERSIQLLKENGTCGIILPLSILSNDRSVYIFARKILLLFTEIISIVELREKTFVQTNTTSCIIFFRKRRREEILDAFDILLQDKSIKCKNELLILKNLFFETYKNGIISNVVISSPYIMKVIEQVNMSIKSVFAFSGEKKRQEFFLGYRYSKGRKREGVNWLKKSLLFNYSGKSIDTLDIFIKNAFEGVFDKRITGELEKHAKIVNLNDNLDFSEVLHISTPSSLIASKTIEIKSISPYGDFIDSIDNSPIILSEFIDNGDIQILSGLVYDKNLDEVPEESNVKVLTASNIDIKTGSLIFGNKMIHLREDFPIKEYKNITIKKNDIIMSMSSGSLKHLGKVAFADKNYENIMIGGFLNIIRVKNEKLALALYFRFMSKSFREYVFSKKGQNINNLNMTEIVNSPINLPVDLDSFNKIYLKNK